MKEASHLLLELVNDVLDMSKLESGEIVLEETPFNLSKISKEVLIVIEQIAAEQNIQIEWEKKEIIHRNLIGSPGYVKRVMMNILSNAVKYNRANGHIYISCMEIPSEQPCKEISDFGDTSVRYQSYTDFRLQRGGGRGSRGGCCGL